MGFTSFVSRNTYVSTQELKTELEVIFPLCSDNDVGRDIVVSIATRYGVDGPGIESRWAGEISRPLHSGPGAHPASCTMGTGSLSRW